MKVIQNSYKSSLYVTSLLEQAVYSRLKNLLSASVWVPLYQKLLDNTSADDCIIRQI